MAEQSGKLTSLDDQVSGRTSELCEPCKKKNKRTTDVVFCKNCNQKMATKSGNKTNSDDNVSGRTTSKLCEPYRKKNKRLTAARVIPKLDMKGINKRSRHDRGFECEPCKKKIKRSTAALVIPQLDMKGLDKCSKHDKVFEFFCVGHQALCCSSCAFELHRKCDEVNGLSTQVDKSSVNATILISTMTEMKARASSVVDHVQETKVTMKSQIADLPRQVDDMKDKVMKKFETLKQTVIKKANTTEKQLARELDKKASTTKDIAQSLEKSVATLKMVVSQGSPVQIYIAMHVLQKQIEPDQSTLKEQQDGLHTVNFSMELGNLNVDKTYINAGTKSELKPMQLTLMTSVEAKQTTEDIREPLYSGLSFLPDGRLVAIDNKNWTCYIMNEKLEKLGMYKFKDYPQSVAVISQTQVAVTGIGKGDKSIHTLQVSKSNVITLTRTVKCSSRYHSICLMNDTTFIVSTFDDKRPVRMISMTGEESDFPGLPEEYKVGMSASTYIRDRNMIVLSDRNGHVVYLYDVNDKTCVTRCVVKDENIKEPKGVCVGPDDCIFVCSKGTNSIVQVSLAGKVISSHKVDMEYPWAVCVSPDESKLAVSGGSVGNSKLCMYKLGGK